MGGTRVRVKSILASYGLDNKFTIRTVGFSDLARDSKKFVEIKNLKPAKIASEIKEAIEVGDDVVVSFRQGEG